ncbi:MAG: HupE/UreJ family protein [Rhodocyclales bacterium]|nr:HupE/UreJ family protein [Rhodocyclales bacterium]
MNKFRFPLALALTLLAGSASAHPGHETVSFMTGFGHPLGGLDHLLAMLAVGLYAAHQPARVRWVLPATFVAAMLGGALLSAGGVALAGVESGIAASVLVLGLLIACVVRMPLGVSVPLVGLFALLHGHAHLSEMEGSAVLTYIAGFMGATMLLHALGFAVARMAPATRAGARLQRLAGGAIAAAGAVMLGA